MRVIETTGKTIEEAIDIALVELNASREEVEIKVISRGKSGLLGFGNEEAKVKVEKKSDVSENIQIAYEILRNILGFLDFISCSKLRLVKYLDPGLIVK